MSDPHVYNAAINKWQDAMHIILKVAVKQDLWKTKKLPDQDDGAQRWCNSKRLSTAFSVHIHDTFQSNIKPFFFLNLEMFPK